MAPQVEVRTNYGILLMISVKLKTPENVDVVGIKLIDGTISSFEFFKKNNTCLYELPPGDAGKMLMIAGDYILIDAKGNEWLSSGNRSPVPH